MINLKYGISYITGVDGASYFESEDAKVYLVVAVRPEDHSVDTFLCVAGSEEWAAKGITEQFDLPSRGYQVVIAQSLYEMLKKLEGGLNEA